MKWIGFAAVVVLMLAGCAASGPQESKAPGAKAGANRLVPEGSVRFILMGDVGTGQDPQRRVADALKSVCEQKGCQFVIIAGDNIYPAGATSAEDPQFEEKFETPYRDIDLPFYLVLGNHDNGGSNGEKPEEGEHEVEYHLRMDRLSEKWHMPARFYTFTFGDVQFFGLDSGPEEVSQNPYWLPGTKGPTMEQWLTSELANSKAKWKIAFAHHPYVSNGPHGNAGLYDNVPGRGLPYKSMLERTVCGQTPIFLAGHDHNLQWLKSVQSCGKTEFLVSGAGGAGLYAKGPRALNEAYFEDYTHFGFVWVDITGPKMTGEFYDDSAKKLGEHSLTLA